MQHKRSLRNLRLTKDFHFRYLGLWIIICMTLLVAVNVTLFLWVSAHFSGMRSILSGSHTKFIEFREYIMYALFIEMCIFGIGLVALAKLTAHRIAGPYIRLQRTFDSIREGNSELRLSFRDYDGLDHVAESFNQMMETVSKRENSA